MMYLMYVKMAPRFSNYCIDSNLSIELFGAIVTYIKSLTS